MSVETIRGLLDIFVALLSSKTVRASPVVSYVPTVPYLALMFHWNLYMNLFYEHAPPLPRLAASPSPTGARKTLLCVRSRDRDSECERK